MNVYARIRGGGLRKMVLDGYIEDPSKYLARHRVSLAVNASIAGCTGPVLAVIDGGEKGKYPRLFSPNNAA